MLTKAIRYCLYDCVERILTNWSHDALFRQSQRKLSTLLRGLQRWLVASCLNNTIRLLMVFLGLLYYLYLFGAPSPACFSLRNAELHCVLALALANVIVVVTLPVGLSMS
jgi:hypothetical protein